MGRIADFLFGAADDPPTLLAEERAQLVANFHSTTLEELLVATSLQQGSGADTAFKVPAFYRGVQILTDTAASFPWFVFAGGRHSGSRQVGLPERLEELPTILVQPDPLVSRDDWLRYVVMSLIMRGNAYLLGSLYVEGHPTRVQVLNPDQVTVAWADQAMTRRSYSWGVDNPLPTSQVRHLALNLRPNALTGLGPVQAAQDVITGQTKADEWARDLFSESGVPSGKLMHPGKLTVDEALELATAWDLSHQQSRKTAVLSGGIDYETISLTPDQAQFLQSRSFGVAEIARLLGIPAHLLNATTGVAGASGTSLTYTNVRDVWVELLQLTLQPVYLDRIAEAMSSFVPRGTSVAFDTSAFMRADEGSRYSAHETALRAGFLTVDEVRAKEGLAPSPELEAEKAEGRRIAEQIASGGSQEDDGEEENDEADQPAGAVSGDA